MDSDITCLTNHNGHLLSPLRLVDDSMSVVPTYDLPNVSLPYGHPNDLGSNIVSNGRSSHMSLMCD